MKKIISNTFAITILLSPLLAFAQPSDRLQGTYRIFSAARNIVEQILVPLAFIIGLLMFFWGIVKYIKSEGDDKAQGKKIMVWGIVAIFVMSAVWGLVAFIGEELGVDYIKDATIPGVKQ